MITLSKSSIDSSYVKRQIAICSLTGLTVPNENWEPHYALPLPTLPGKKLWPVCNSLVAAIAIRKPSLSEHHRHMSLFRDLYDW